ncbi:glycosyltransferase family 2 protein [Candidatus Woesearchaeota archaeon]|nr:glycosyltransferase family 2 protein [Candidatus Woesearchaeota archaeon]
MNIFIVIAAYNEEKSITTVVKSLREKGYDHIIVVDDGSRDRTSQYAEQEGATVLQHVVNLGQGAALKTGIDYALMQGADIIVTFDADGQHDAGDLRQLLKPVIDKNIDVTLGSRFLKHNSNVPFIRKCFLKGGAFLFKVMYGVTLTDSHNGLRAFSKKAAKVIDLKTNGMEHASEMIEEIGKHKLSYKEIPVTIRYTDYSTSRGQSSWNAFRIFFKMIMKKLLL